MKVSEFFRLLKEDIKEDIKEESIEWKEAIDEVIELILKSLKRKKRRFKRKISKTKLGREVDETLDAYMKRDPAAKSKLEVLLLYPGVHAILAHRIAHKLYKKGYNFSARAVSQISRFMTGIEIHPGATIGKRFVIDHGMGVVIGETAIIGDDVLVYQGVTLGGSGKEKKKRHPTIENGVMVGCGAKVLGSFKVGEGSRVASNAVVLKEIPKEATAVGIPAKVVRINGEKPEETLDHIHIPDPISAELDKMKKRIEELEKALNIANEAQTVGKTDCAEKVCGVELDSEAKGEDEKEASFEPAEVYENKSEKANSECGAMDEECLAELEMRLIESIVDRELIRQSLTEDERKELDALEESADGMSDEEFLDALEGLAEIYESIDDSRARLKDLEEKLANLGGKGEDETLAQEEVVETLADDAENIDPEKLKKDLEELEAEIDESLGIIEKIKEEDEDSEFDSKNLVRQEAVEPFADEPNEQNAENKANKKRKKNKKD